MSAPYGADDEDGPRTGPMDPRLSQTWSRWLDGDIVPIPLGRVFPGGRPTAQEIADGMLASQSASLSYSQSLPPRPTVSIFDRLRECDDSAPQGPSALEPNSTLLAEPEPNVALVVQSCVDTAMSDVAIDRVPGPNSTLVGQRVVDTARSKLDSPLVGQNVVDTARSDVGIDRALDNSTLVGHNVVGTDRSDDANHRVDMVGSESVTTTEADTVCDSPQPMSVTGSPTPVPVFWANDDRWNNSDLDAPPIDRDALFSQFLEPPPPLPAQSASSSAALVQLSAPIASAAHVQPSAPGEIWIQGNRYKYDRNMDMLQPDDFSDESIRALIADTPADAHVSEAATARRTCRCTLVPCRFRCTNEQEQTLPAMRVAKKSDQTIFS